MHIWKKSFSCYKDVDSQMQWQRSCGSPCKMRKTVAKTVLCWSSSDIYDSNRNIYRKSVIVVRLGPCQQPLLAAVYIVHVYVCLILSRGQRGGGQHIHTRYQFRRDKSPEMQTSLYNGLQTRMHSKKISTQTDRAVQISRVGATLSQDAYICLSFLRHFFIKVHA